MKKTIIGLIALFLVLPARPARADLFGGDVAVLTRILAQAIMQLAKLREILGTAQDQIDLIRQINQGINDSLHLLKTIHPNLDPGIYRDWATVQEALAKLRSIYGDVITSPEAQIQKDTDQGIAEAITFNNAFYKYSQELDQIGERIQAESHNVSPGGATKLTAQALGLVIQVLNQSLRAQATSLKLQGQSLAIQNRKEKEATRHILDSTNSLKASMKAEKAAFQIPRF